MKFIIWSGIIGTVLGTVAIAGIYFYLAPKLPSIDYLQDVRFQVPLRVYSRDGKLLAEFGEKRRVPLNYSQLPPQMINAFLAAEDNRFFQHPGVDYQGLLRAGLQLILTGEKRQGGSTITMQVARNFFLTREKTYLRKVNEILLALKIEQELSKEQILELYLNKIYMGNRAYGVGAAAQVYYGKTVDELALPEIAMVAGLPKAPSRYNPLANPERATTRRDYILGRMAKLDYISEAEQQAALMAPVTAKLHAAKLESEAPYLAEMVRAEMVERFGSGAYTDGYQVQTTLDSHLQGVANRAVRQALQAYDMRHGYRGVDRQLLLTASETDDALDELLSGQRQVADLQPGIVVAVEEKSIEVYLGQGRRINIGWQGLEWAAPYRDENFKGDPPKSASDLVEVGSVIKVQQQEMEGELFWRLSQAPVVSGSLVSIRPDDGSLVALVGGYDFYSSKFNRVIQARRQPGSGFKAFIYSAALEAGYTAASLINDAPVVVEDSALEGTWRPENYSGKFFGPTRLRYALTKSRNLVSIRLLMAMGVGHALKHAQRFGFDPAALPRSLSLALGSGEVTAWQMASAYAVLANGGFRVEPYFIDRILDSDGEILFQANPLTVCESCVQPPEPVDVEGEKSRLVAPRVISPQNHYLMNSMMRDVITRGTGRKALVLKRRDLAGKTGTTNDQRDAWFNGFNRSLVAIAWVGFDSSKPLGRGEVGGRAALPAWISFMAEALKGIEEVPLKTPEGMVSVRIDPKTGKRARADQRNAIFEIFRKENVPGAQAAPEIDITESGTQGGVEVEGNGEGEELF